MDEHSRNKHGFKLVPFRESPATVIVTSFEHYLYCVWSRNVSWSSNTLSFLQIPYIGLNEIYSGSGSMKCYTTCNSFSCRSVSITSNCPRRWDSPRSSRIEREKKNLRWKIKIGNILDETGVQLRHVILAMIDNLASGGLLIERRCWLAA